MRISSNMQYYNFLNSLYRSMNAQAKLNEQIADEQKFHRPSDDPIGVIRSMRYSTDYSKNEQFISNVQAANDLLQTADDSLTQLNDVLTRVKELAIQAITPNADIEYEAVAQEIDGLIDEAVSIANTEVGGQYIFAGQVAETKPFVRTKLLDPQSNLTLDTVLYYGDEQPVSITAQSGEISPSRDSVSVTGSDLFGASTTNYGQTTATFLNNLIRIKEELERDAAVEKTNSQSGDLTVSGSWNGPTDPNDTSNYQDFAVKIDSLRLSLGGVTVTGSGGGVTYDRGSLNLAYAGNTANIPSQMDFWVKSTQMIATTPASYTKTGHGTGEATAGDISVERNSATATITSLAVRVDAVKVDVGAVSQSSPASGNLSVLYNGYGSGGLVGGEIPDSVQVRVAGWELNTTGKAAGVNSNISGGQMTFSAANPAAGATELPTQIRIAATGAGGAVTSVEYRTDDMPPGTWNTPIAGPPFTLPASAGALSFSIGASGKNAVGDEYEVIGLSKQATALDYSLDGGTTWSTASMTAGFPAGTANTFTMDDTGAEAGLKISIADSIYNGSNIAAKLNSNPVYTIGLTATSQVMEASCSLNGGLYITAAVDNTQVPFRFTDSTGVVSFAIPAQTSEINTALEDNFVNAPQTTVTVGGVSVDVGGLNIVETAAKLNTACSTSPGVAFAVVDNNDGTKSLKATNTSGAAVAISTTVASAAADPMGINGAVAAGGTNVGTVPLYYQHSSASAAVLNKLNDVHDLSALTDTGRVMSAEYWANGGSTVGSSTYVCSAGATINISGGTNPWPAAVDISGLSVVQAAAKLNAVYPGSGATFSAVDNGDGTCSLRVTGAGLTVGGTAAATLGINGVVPANGVTGTAEVYHPAAVVDYSTDPPAIQCGSTGVTAVIGNDVSNVAGDHYQAQSLTNSGSAATLSYSLDNGNHWSRAEEVPVTQSNGNGANAFIGGNFRGAPKVIDEIARIAAVEVTATIGGTAPASALKLAYSGADPSSLPAMANIAIDSVDASGKVTQITCDGTPVTPTSDGSGRFNYNGYVISISAPATTGQNYTLAAQETTGKAAIVEYSIDKGASWLEAGPPVSVTQSNTSGGALTLGKAYEFSGLPASSSFKVAVQQLSATGNVQSIRYSTDNGTTWSDDIAVDTASNTFDLGNGVAIQIDDNTATREGDMYNFTLTSPAENSVWALNQGATIDIGANSNNSGGDTYSFRVPPEAALGTTGVNGSVAADSSNRYKDVYTFHMEKGAYGPDNSAEMTSGPDLSWMSEVGLADIEESMSQIQMAQVTVGTRASTYTMIQTMLEDNNLNINQLATDNAGLDVAKATVDLKQAETTYRMALALGGKIMPTSLIDFLK
ncbi:MAG TPA: flagellar hook-associated protein FlgL [Patescibacteria group bacterium]|nr:flagellar hook-associated protein FlgL [Patescibacteria group bacterium]